MQVTELFETLKEEFPDKLSDVLESLNLYKFTLDDVMRLISKKREQTFHKRDFAEDERLTSMGRKLYDYICDIESLIKVLEDDDIKGQEDMDEETEKSIIPNYSEYVVDDTIPHSLYEDFRHIRPKAFEIDGQRVDANTFKEVLGETCKYLLSKDPAKCIALKTIPI